MAVNLADRTGIIIDPPQLTMPGFGLRSVVQFPLGVDPHWQNTEQGVQWREDGQATSQSTTGVLLTSEHIVDTIWGQAKPVTVQVVRDVSTIPNADDARRVVGQYLNQSADNALELALWTGKDSDGNDLELSLAQADVLTDTPMDFDEGVGVLEQWLSQHYNGVGVIHAPRRTAAVMGRFNVVSTSSGAKVTQLGTKVAFGIGYPGSQPGTLATEDTLLADPVWLAITPAVMMLQGDDLIVPDVPHSIQWEHNRVVMAAQRQYLVAWEGPSAMLPVTLQEGLA